MTNLQWSHRTIALSMLMYKIYDCLTESFPSTSRTKLTKRAILAPVTLWISGQTLLSAESWGTPADLESTICTPPPIPSPYCYCFCPSMHNEPFCPRENNLLSKSLCAHVCAPGPGGWNLVDLCHIVDQLAEQKKASHARHFFSIIYLYVGKDKLPIHVALDLGFGS